MQNVDFFGGFDLKHLGHHAGLYGPNGPGNNGADYPAVDTAVSALLKQGVPAKKLVLSVAMYGQGWAGVQNYQNDNPFTGEASYVPWGDFVSCIKDYKTIVKLDESKYGFGFDDKAKAAYAFDKAGTMLYSFDNPESVKAKGFYVQQKNLGGLLGMTIDGDDGALMNAMYEGLTEAPPPEPAGSSAH